MALVDPLSLTVVLIFRTVVLKMTIMRVYFLCDRSRVLASHLPSRITMLGDTQFRYQAVVSYADQNLQVVLYPWLTENQIFPCNIQLKSDTLTNVCFTIRVSGKIQGKNKIEFQVWTNQGISPKNSGKNQGI